MNVNSFLDKLEEYIPIVKKPSKPLSLREKVKWTLIVLVIYYILYNTYAIGVSPTSISQPILQLISIVFAARIGSIITVGISPIVLASILLQLLVGSGVIKVDYNNIDEKARFQTAQKALSIIIAAIESFIYAYSGYVPLANPSFAGIVALQLFIGAILIIYLDELLSTYGITSGINIFIAAGVSFSIVASTFGILLQEAIASATSGGVAALPGIVEAFLPLIFAIVILLFGIYLFQMQVELPLSFSQFRGISGRLPIPFLYVNVIPVILAESLELSLTFWFRFLINVHGPLLYLARFIAYYQLIPSTTGAVTPQLVGGLIYLISPQFPLPYSANFGGIGSYSAYVTFLLTESSPLYLPNGSIVQVPEWIHVIVYTVVLMLLCVVFGKLWIELSGQGPKELSKQIIDLGWAIPGFRRDPRMVESILNRYIPQLVVVSSMVVGLLAALATISGAIGGGIGVLLTGGIIYMLYMQLKQEQLLETYPILEKIANT
ncbi:MAG: protein translocase subunit SecY [Candidatus Micrarchaeota archaeon]|nr:MAG: protein translocase subunit SecY [Candidatus Micrarchaeota archaeon]